MLVVLTKTLRLSLRTLWLFISCSVGLFWLGSRWARKFWPLPFLLNCSLQPIKATPSHWSPDPSVSRSIQLSLANKTPNSNCQHLYLKKEKLNTKKFVILTGKFSHYNLQFSNISTPPPDYLEVTECTSVHLPCMLSPDSCTLSECEEHRQRPGLQSQVSDQRGVKWIGEPACSPPAAQTWNHCAAEFVDRWEWGQ